PRAVAGAGEDGLSVVEEPAVGRVEARLRDLSCRLPGVVEGLESDRGRGPETRPLLEPHPGAGDHAQDSFGADEEAISGDSGAVPRKPARLQGAARRENPHSLHEVVE